jgi:DNA (cytosine-5)-methyltransferase 1
LRYLSVCSGIEAATVAWHPIGWSPVAFAEIEKFPSAVLAHHYGSNMPGQPLSTNGVPNFGDITKFKDWPDATLDVLVGGTPCQSFSVAGLRQGLADPRGNLCLTYLAIADRYRPEWILWENVPGVLSSDGGRDFGAFLGGLGQLGYGWSYRVLDAQYVRVDGFGRAVPQRRRRVFVVGNLRDWRRAAAVLFERESLQGNTPPRREAGQGFAGATGNGATGYRETGQGWWTEGIAGLRADPGGMPENVVAHSLRAEGFDTSEDGTGRGTPLIPIDMRQASRGDRMTNNRADGSSGGAPGTGIGKDGDPSPTIASSHIPAIAFAQNQRDELREMDVAGALAAEPGMKQQTYLAFQSKASATQSMAPGVVTPSIDVGKCDGLAVAFDMRGREGGSQFEGPHDTANIRAASGGSSRSYVAQTWAVRRLIPDECEKLQGFKPGYTNIPWRGKNGAPDGPRYKALGNSMAVNVMRWLGTRIQMVSEIADAQAYEAAE